MAENTTTGQEPHLRKGRSADPEPRKAKGSPSPENTRQTSPAAGSPQETAGTSEQKAAPTPAGNSSPGKVADTDSKDQAQVMARSRQRRLRLLLRQCDRVLLMDFELLAMSDWPDNYSMAAARRNRDLWMLSALVAALVFLSGLTGFVPAWIAGGGFGAFVIILLLGLPGVRQLYTSRPSYLDLILKRQRMMREARKHVAHLEGKEGLAWQCARLAEFNPALRSPRFGQLVSLSEHRVLARNLTRREHIRLFLVYLLEAEKGYERLQQAYLEGHQTALDEGWQPEPVEQEDAGEQTSDSDAKQADTDQEA